MYYLKNEGYINGMESFDSDALAQDDSTHSDGGYSRERPKGVESAGSG